MKLWPCLIWASTIVTEYIWERGKRKAQQFQFNYSYSWFGVQGSWGWEGLRQFFFSTISESFVFCSRPHFCSVRCGVSEPSPLQSTVTAVKPCWTCQRRKLQTFYKLLYCLALKQRFWVEWEFNDKTLTFVLQPHKSPQSSAVSRV